nr:Chain D, MAP3K2 peptide [Homo sapiens]
EKFGKGGTYP